MIQADSLTRRFGPTVALQELSCGVAAGEIVGFLGPNGAGKTTAMRIFTGSLAPSGGRVEVGGYDVVRQSVAVRRQIGFMPEHVPLYPDNTVGEFLRFVGRLKGVPAGRLESQLADITDRAGVAEVQERLIGNLSKGYRQRVGLAQALVGDPPVLILDEPTAGLDPHQIVEVRELIRSFRGQKTVLLSSHILNEVSLVCQRVLILDQGHLVAEERPETLAQKSRGQGWVRLSWRGSREAVLGRLAKVPGVERVTPTDSGADVLLEGEPDRVRPQLAQAVLDAGGGLQGMESRTPTLEDLFLSVTRDDQGAAR
jgi:ABC-2 type transport system ATP-binding protein